MSDPNIDDTMMMKGAGDPSPSNVPPANSSNVAPAPTLEQIQNETTTSVVAAPAVTSPSIATATEMDGTFPTAPNTNNMYPSFDGQPDTTTTTIDRSMFGPAGRWQKGIFQCCQFFPFSSLWWMSCCCTPCVYGQLAQRMNLTACMTQPPPPQRASGTCMTVLVITALCYLIFWFFAGWLITLLFYAFCFYFFFMGILLRNIIRKRYSIPTHYTQLETCDGILEDFFLAFCCSCCSSIQMARQTHDESRFPYNACSTTGLMTYAPEISWDTNLGAGEHDYDPTFFQPVVSPPTTPTSTTAVSGATSTSPQQQQQQQSTNNVNPHSTLSAGTGQQPSADINMSNVELV